VRAYNAAWDYFAGMSGAQIEAQVRHANLWERPSWPLGEWRQREQNLRDEIHRAFFSDAPGEELFPHPPPMPKAEHDALAVLELVPPVTFAAIKAQYRVLVKRHHPDLHGGSPEAAEKFKGINQACTVLRRVYDTEEDA
jgi:DnaJ-domain-containing protein 1